MKQPSELLAGASRRPVTTGQCSDLIDDGGLSVSSKPRQCGCKCKCKCVLLWLLCCAVLCCAVLCCVLPCLHRHRCAQGKAAAIDRAEQRGTRYQSKTQRKEKRRPKQHHSRPGDQLGRVESRLVRLPRCCSEAGKGQTRPSLASVPSRCTEIASWASCWCNWNECLESTRHRGLPARR